MIDVGTAVGYLMLDTTGFQSGFRSAMTDMRTFQSDTATVADKFSSVGSAMTSAGGTLTKSVTLPLVGLGTAAVKTASDFESSMSQVQATMGITKDNMSEVDGQTVNTMEALQDIAKEMGATTKFSAKDAADALNYLALAGYDTEKQIHALPSVLTLAAAGNMDLAYASDLVTDSMSVLGLETQDLDGYIDQMAKTASSSNTNVAQLGEAILVAGGQASLCGMNTTELNTALGILADNGMKGSEGGTMLRNTLKNLYTPTDQAAKVMEQLGLVTTNADGSLRDSQEVLKDLSGILDGMSEADRVEAMAQIFDTRTIAGANALLKNSSTRWDELSKAIDGSAGAAQQMADTQLDNLDGQLTILKSGLEGAAIAFGELLLPIIKDVTEVIQGIVDWINNLDEGQKNTIVTIAEVVAAIGPILLIGGKLASGIGKISALISGAGGLGAVMTALTGPIGIIIAAVAALAAAWATNFGGIRDKTHEVMEAIGSIIDSVMTFIKGIWENDLLGIKTYFTDIWNGIEQFFSDTLDIIVDVFNIFASIFKGDWEEVWEGIKTLVSDIWKRIVHLIENWLKTIVDTIVNIGEGLFNAAKEAFQWVMDGFKNIWDKITEWFSKAIEDPVGTIKGIGESLFNAGKEIFTKLWDGIKSIWTDISNWVTEKVNWIVDKVTFWKKKNDEISDEGSTSKGGGLDYPTPGSSNSPVTGGGKANPYISKGGDTYNFYSPTPMDPVSAANNMKRAKQELALGYN